MFFLNQTGTILEMGFIYAVVALGVYITYKILDFPDLSVDGTFPLGGVVFAVLVTAGCPWAVAMIVSFVAGCAAGLVTGLLHVKLKINGLLSGIITMTALISVNYLIAGGPMVSFSQETTMLHNSFVNGFPRLASNFVQVWLTLVLLAACKILLDLYLKTKSGFLLRATGDNPQMVTQLGKNIDNYKMLGLSLANGLVALAGSLYCQYNSVFNSSMGTGTVVIALACVIIGCVIAKHIRVMKDTTGVIIGAVIYYAILTVAMLLLGSDYTQLIVAVLFVVVLIFDSGLIGRTVKKIFGRKPKEEGSSKGGESNA
ncbi:MAG TPA: ABC transporter permease [Candidatus Borkfalkia avistercoris]|uniref:ABC transporter permease n=1 Tax=Candidatus Borkfalkia avistercoris TaxID=2838504 RepID=A0A9D2ID49_9FIRM|nr:ABC transporter permease [Candidatus Borkfalkia avistercoris]